MHCKDTILRTQNNWPYSKLIPNSGNNVAYSKCEALRMISCFEEQGIPVLGGDVFLLKDNIPSLTYDNWYCDKNPQESNQEYVIRSCKKAYEYVSTYNSADSIEVLFSLVH